MPAQFSWLPLGRFLRHGYQRVSVPRGNALQLLVQFTEDGLSLGSALEPALARELFMNGGCECRERVKPTAADLRLHRVVPAGDLVQCINRLVVSPGVPAIPLRRSRLTAYAASATPTTPKIAIHA